MENGNHMWQDAMDVEMARIKEYVVPAGYKHIMCHMDFDIKSDLTHKAWLVAGGHLTDPPEESTYSSVVTWDSVQIAFTLVTLNDLDVLAVDVQNAYLNAQKKECCYMTTGLEWGMSNLNLFLSSM